MAILAPIAHFGILEGLPQDSLKATLERISASELAIILASLLLAAVAILDIVVAKALYTFLRPSRQPLIGLMALLRVVYAIGFLGAIGFLISLISRINGTDLVSPLAISDLKGFEVAWDIALVFFAVHLALLGWLFYKVKYTPTWLGVLLAVAGLGYAIDSFAKYAVHGYTFELSTITFIGEAILIFWLLIRGRTLKSSDLKKR